VIAIAASTSLDPDVATAAAAEAIRSAGGFVEGIRERSNEATIIGFDIPALGLASLGAFLGAAGLQLDPDSDVAMSGISAGVHATTVRGTLYLQFVDDGS
jgi:hypothetical protein